MTDGLISLALFAVTAIAAILLVGLIHRRALARGHLDLPNERSSHSLPTPSGGGIAIIVVWVIAIVVLWVAGIVSGDLAIAIGPPAILLAVTGYVDDRVDLSRLLRLAIQVLAVGWFLYVSNLPISADIRIFVGSPLSSTLIAAVALVWLINLFNFMDGIDGIAACEAIFVLLALGGLSGISGAAPLALMATALAGACAGFLWWNWPPAKIFMGNVGSACIGFLIGAIGLIAVESAQSAPLMLVILLGVFLVDATVTLIRRVLSGQRWYSAHRSHAYQKLAIRWAGHRRVTLTTCLVNIGWLLPMAIGVHYLPEYAAIITLVALGPILAAVLWLGAGSADSSQN